MKKVTHIQTQVTQLHKLIFWVHYSDHANHQSVVCASKLARFFSHRNDWDFQLCLDHHHLETYALPLSPQKSGIENADLKGNRDFFSFVVKCNGTTENQKDSVPIFDNLNKVTSYSLLKVFIKMNSKSSWILDAQRAKTVCQHVTKDRVFLYFVEIDSNTLT